MRVVVDPDKCVGHGRCYALAPDVFEPDDDGYCMVRHYEVWPAVAELVRRAVANCPEEALTIED
ncbi:MAG: ferredoxin [Actinobacteria bacterium]|nr:ferredoxin [Actinomycetota bacterium]